MQITKEQLKQIIKEEIKYQGDEGFVGPEYMDPEFRDQTQWEHEIEEKIKEYGFVPPEDGSTGVPRHIPLIDYDWDEPTNRGNYNALFSVPVAKIENPISLDEEQKIERTALNNLKNYGIPAAGVDARFAEDGLIGVYYDPNKDEDIDSFLKRMVEVNNIIRNIGLLQPRRAPESSGQLQLPGVKENNMKITKEQLKQLVKEEISQVYAERPAVDANADVPSISDEQRAQELLNQFKSMLKPEEQQIEGSCGTFLRQLAVLSDRMEKGSVDGTNTN